MSSLTRRAALGALAAFAAAPARAQAPRPLLVFAAASLQPTLTQALEGFRAPSGRGATISYASSAALARQLDQGAPADLFLSADEEWMEWAADRRLVRVETRRALLGNRLALIAARDDRLELAIAPGFPLAQAIGASRLATGAPASVPVGRYAREALTALGVWDTVAPRIAGVDNVRVAVTLVARGEARLGIVYATDAVGEERVRVVGLFPTETHRPIVYPVAATPRADAADAAALLAHLSGPEAARLFTAAGFTVLR